MTELQTRVECPAPAEPPKPLLDHYLQLIADPKTTITPAKEQFPNPGLHKDNVRGADGSELEVTTYTKKNDNLAKLLYENYDQLPETYVDRIHDLAAETKPGVLERGQFDEYDSFGKRKDVSFSVLNTDGTVDRRVTALLGAGEHVYQEIVSARGQSRSGNSNFEFDANGNVTHLYCTPISESGN